MTDPYQTLGLATGASPEECKAAFRRLAKTCHPDTHPNDARAEAQFKEINAAYHTIINPQPEVPNGFGQSNNWNTFHFNFNTDSPLNDFFAQMRRTDVMFEVRLTLEDAFTGKEITVQVPAGNNGHRDLKVRIPPGTEDGMRLIIPQGGPPASNGRAIDVVIVIRLLAHERFTRYGQNLLISVPVTAFDVLLGNEINVTCIDGHTMCVAIPSNFDSTRKLRLAGQGMRDQAGQRGDLLVDLFVQYPTVPAELKATLRTIAETIQHPLAK